MTSSVDEALTNLVRAVKKDSNKKMVTHLLQNAADRLKEVESRVEEGWYANAASAHSEAMGIIISLEEYCRSNEIPMDALSINASDGERLARLRRILAPDYFIT